MAGPQKLAGSNSNQNNNNQEGIDQRDPLCAGMGCVLKPFVHQVSGRAHMLALNKETICKSLSDREWMFYLQLTPAIQQFAPVLKGILCVLLENSQRFRSIDACIIKAPVSNDVKLKKAETFNGNHKVEKILFKGLGRTEYSSNDGFTDHPWTVDKDQDAVTEAFGQNPWSLRQHRREINRTLKGDTLRKEVDLDKLWSNSHGDAIESYRALQNQAKQNGHKVKAYLLLDDVTSCYQFPNILDLKIGTQIDRAGCSPAKKDKHLNLVQRSSTGSLGLRLAGMQVYQVNERQYLCRDKYFGRGLSTKGFIDTLHQFLHNGQRIVTEVIPPIVDRLVALRRSIEQHESYRFFASSILLSYEGNSTSNVPLCNVHMIDFAHSTKPGFLDDKIKYPGPDNDCLHALDNLVSILNNLLQNPDAGVNTRT
nr:inositol hexakisphosphate kinase 1 [Ciona intestinalis]|eukprot:XP_002123506.1 inositol hexakisphosphate kinase 1 [Ciona intestinalis]